MVSIVGSTLIDSQSVLLESKSNFLSPSRFLNLKKNNKKQQQKKKPRWIPLEEKKKFSREPKNGYCMGYVHPIKYLF